MYCNLATLLNGSNFDLTGHVTLATSAQTTANKQCCQTEPNGCEMKSLCDSL